RSAIFSTRRSNTRRSPTARGGRLPRRSSSSPASRSRFTSSTRRWKGSSIPASGSKGMGTPVLEVDDLRIHYLTRFGQKIQAVDGVSFSLEEGEILGIAGESGCGKTTLVSGCMGLYLPPLYHTSGDVRVAGRSIVGMSVEQNRKEVLGQLVAMIPQGALNSLN